MFSSVDRGKRKPKAKRTKMDLTIKHIRVFVPAKDFRQSLHFYTSLGWALKWQANDNNLAQLELAGNQMLLQDFYVEAWAHNFVFNIAVEDATAWYEHIKRVLEADDFGDARVQAPKKEPYGALATHAWDPSGVLLSFMQFLPD